MFSSFDDTATILRYLRVGTDDFLSKETPYEQLPELLFECWQRVLAKRALSRDTHEPVTLKHVTLAGRSMHGVLTELRHLLETPVRSIHLFGETGTGKEIAAGILRSLLNENQPFLSVNCAAISPSLLESQLFGHKKGSFTGADRDHPGYFEAASGGWLFLDEVADLSLSAQAALLRVIESGEIIRLGESKTRKVNVRILSATNQDLLKKVHEGDFRLDLLERLCAHRILLSPLRQRKDEIEPLSKLFLSEIKSKNCQFAKTTMELLALYHWPTNVRELKNVISDMVTFSSGNVLLPSSIPQRIIDSLIHTSKPLEETKNESLKSNQNEVGTISVSFTGLPRPLKELEDELFIAYVDFLVDKKKISSVRALASAMEKDHATTGRRLDRLMKKKSSLNISRIVRLFWEKAHVRKRK